MDSLSQFVLGAAVATAVAGPKIGARKAALLGGALGTLPDLDVFIPFGNPIDDFILHRGFSHSLIVHAALTPVLGELVRRSFSALRERRVIAWSVVFLVLSTHALLDAMTIYGTRLFWPVWDEPLGLGSIFIIDPLYTIPLLIVTLWAFCRAELSGRLRRASHLALALSTLYLGWSMIAQMQAEERGKAVLANAGLSSEEVSVGPMPFNTLLWRITAIDGDQYHNVYLSLIGKDEDVALHSHHRLDVTVECLQSIKEADKLYEFADGFVEARYIDGKLRVSDLRMGVIPNYVFSFDVAELNGDQLKEIAPVRRLANSRSEEGDDDWLLAALKGQVRPRPAETLLSARTTRNLAESGVACYSRAQTRSG